MPKFAPAHLTDLITRVFENSRVAPATARIVAEALVRAEADGISSHGVARVPPYAEQAMNGKVDGFAEPSIARTAAAVLDVDSRIGFAFPAIRLGLEAAADIVGDTGIVAIGIKHSHHFGVAGHHVEDAANRGLMALAFSNTPAAIAPWGGARALYGTNPIAFACPRADGPDGEKRPPLVIDLSVSTVARGKVVLAAKAGETIPDDWALDADGRPTTDPKVGLEGSMAPLGGRSAGAKGAALGLMVELLCGALTGSNFGYQGSSFFEPTGAPPSIGHLILVMDPKAFGGGAGTVARAEEMFAEILKEPGTRLPGDSRLAKRAAAPDGITVPDALAAELEARAAAG
ncbi:sulfolactate dehydrogenase [Thalassobaculum fulvum]|uniref:Sulfolactate dehydrogenase n=1 Tax=Thalassobaculum fulvum TaxID=1633335 RepID=A0A918XYC5_9PROT|nr:Ldh family oxidoreductase [Thalassobaculum fulvum]GHD63935.1 sulfolactate dehydrogenase [Thalassobaculum fulvum]